MGSGQTESWDAVFALGDACMACVMGKRGMVVLIGVAALRVAGGCLSITGTSEQARGRGRCGRLRLASPLCVCHSTIAHLKMTMIQIHGAAHIHPESKLVRYAIDDCGQRDVSTVIGR
jgi:hypothetical protein